MTLFLLLMACNGETAIDPRDTDPECVDDGDCDRDEICDPDACVTGDRTNDIASALPIVKTIDPDDMPSAVGLIETEGDIDYYALTVIDPGWVRVQTVSEFPEELDTVVAILDASGGLHAWVDDFATGSINTYDSVLHAYLPTAGVWYITVQDANTWFDRDELVSGSDLEYSLSVLDFGQTTTETDAIDNPSRDVDITTGTSIYTVGVNLESPDDHDFITVQLPYDDAPIEVYSLTELPGSDARVRSQILSADGTVLSDKRDLGSDGAQGAFGLASGTYTLDISDAFDGGSANHWAPIYIRTRPDGEHYTLEVEPNGLDTPQALPAEDLTTQGGSDYQRVWVEGRLDSAEDDDVFTFAAATDDRITIRCGGENLGSSADAALELSTSDGTVVATESDGDDAMPDLENFGPIAAGDTYTMRLFGEGNSVYGPAAFYRCVVFITPFEVVR